MDQAKRLRKSSRMGTTIVEAAFVLPLLLLLVLGGLEYGWLFFNVQQITNAARQGARVACLPDATDSQVQAVIAGILDRAKLQQYGPTVEINMSDLVEWPDPENPNQNIVRGAVTVRITIPTANLHIINMNAFSPTGEGLEPENIGATVTMAKEGT
jgi:Flp pilus assembly protein TadG